MNKLFIIGLPRTGTTSVSAALLELGFKVAHTAFTERTFELAQVFSDTPCYCDYRQLDAMFPDSKFVYLNRDIDAWITSIQMLLTKMQKNLSPNGHFNPIMKRCFNHTFKLETVADFNDVEHLRQCYITHQQQVCDYFSARNDWLSIDVSETNSYLKLIDFLGPNQIIQNPEAEQDQPLVNDYIASFPHLNAGRMVTTWKDIKHPNKINSNASGPNRRKFLNYPKTT